MTILESIPEEKMEAKLKPKTSPTPKSISTNNQSQLPPPLLSPPPPPSSQPPPPQPSILTLPRDSSTTQSLNMSLVSECDLKEMAEVIKDHPKLSEAFKSFDDLIHALKVVSSIKPNDKISTNTGFYIQTELTRPQTWGEWAKQYLQPVWFVRLKNGDDRITNLKAIKAIFVGALVIVEQCLQERETMASERQTHAHSARLDVVKKIKNEQLITRMAEAITKAVGSLENLKQTYTGDAHTCARIEMLSETIRDRLLLIKTSLEFLK